MNKRRVGNTHIKKFYVSSTFITSLPPAGNIYVMQYVLDLFEIALILAKEGKKNKKSY